MKSLFNVKVFVFSIAIFSIIGSAQAQTITINDNLYFGRFAIVDNAAPRSITILPGGGHTADPQYAFLDTPTLGNVTVDGYPASSTLTVTVGTTTVGPVGGGTAVFMTNTTFTDPAVVTTDGTGSATFDVGATLTSDGSGVTHTDVNYHGIFSITVTP